MRNAPLTGLLLMSALVAGLNVMQMPRAPTGWPDAAFAAAPDAAAPDAAGTPAGGMPAATAPPPLGASVAAEAVAVLGLDADPALFIDEAGISVRLPRPDAAPDRPPAALAVAAVRSLPGGNTAFLPPRHATWPATPARPQGCPFTSAQACTAWHAGP